MWLVCSTSVTADRDQQHGPQSWAPADRKSKWKKHDAIPRLLHHQRRKFQTHDTHIYVNSWATCITFPDGPLMCLCRQCHKKPVGYFFFFFVRTWDYKTVFPCCRWQPAARYSSNWNQGFFKSATRSSASLLLIIINWKIQDEAVAYCSSFHRP